MCVNQHGVAIPVVKWDDLGFEGKCQKVDMCQVIPGRWQSILGEQRKLTAKLAEAGIAD